MDANEYYLSVVLTSLARKIQRLDQKKVQKKVDALGRNLKAKQQKTVTSRVTYMR